MSISHYWRCAWFVILVTLAFFALHPAEGLAQYVLPG